MSLLPAYFGARKRDTDQAPPTDEAENDQLRRDIFDLIPPRAANRATAIADPEPAPAVEAEAEQPAAKPIGRNKHPVDMTDLSRLSIDNDGRLYWDGKPVEVNRRLMMSRKQVLGAILIALFIIIGAAGAAIQGASVAHDWACKLGLTGDYCALPPAPPPQPARHDIPA